MNAAVASAAPTVRPSTVGSDREAAVSVPAGRSGRRPGRLRADVRRTARAPVSNVQGDSSKARAATVTSAAAMSRPARPESRPAAAPTSEGEHETPGGGRQRSAGASRSAVRAATWDRAAPSTPGARGEQGERQQHAGRRAGEPGRTWRPRSGRRGGRRAGRGVGDPIGERPEPRRPTALGGRGGRPTRATPHTIAAVSSRSAEARRDRVQAQHGGRTPAGPARPGRGGEQRRSGGGGHGGHREQRHRPPGHGRRSRAASAP